VNKKTGVSKDQTNEVQELTEGKVRKGGTNKSPITPKLTIQPSKQEPPQLKIFRPERPEGEKDKKPPDAPELPQPDPSLQVHDIRHELWREYQFGGGVYHIDHPMWLITRPGGTTHRVVTGDGVAHCIPAVGHCGCVLRWKTIDGVAPVIF